ncbi:MAG: FecR domain-containing protein [SAR324 cluster bacterium]|nr:FecR domain-containing protein [SAR324 cluster bacterium]
MTPARRLLLLLLFWGFAVSLAYGQAPVGELEVEQGRVKIRHLTVERIFEEVGLRIPVFVGDALHTSGDTRVKIRFRDEDEIITLYSNTHFKVAVHNPRRSSFFLNIGKAFFGVLRRRNPFEVKTAQATIGVKGTEFVVGTDGQKSFLLTVTGVVGMRSVAFPGREVVVTQDQASSVAANQPPAPPVAVTPETRDQIVAEEGLAQFEVIAFETPEPGTEEEAQEEESQVEEGQQEEGQEEEGEGEQTQNGPGSEAEVPLPPVSEVVSEVLETVADTQETISQSTESVLPTTPTPAPITLQLRVNR